MYEFYTSKLPESTQKRLRKALKYLYESIPSTEGCMENIGKADGCGAWCCRHQSPQVMFSEFQYAWHHIVHSWSKEDLISLIFQSIKVYLEGKPTKGCILWNEEDKMCRIHEKRPMNCRFYGQIPDEEFQPRLAALKVLYENNPDVVLRDQCNLVKTVGKKPTSADIDDWFNQLKMIEMDSGIHPKHINDGEGGSYRTYHDHILLQIANPAFLSRLTTIREKHTSEQKEQFLAMIQKKIAKELPAILKEKVS